MVKRFLDIILCVSILFVASPLLLLTAIIIKLTSKGPVIYRSKRAGLNGKPFYMFKFRTMVTGADQESSITIGQDSRITAVGRLLRKTKIDELPQCWNIILGDMSIVGPRPESSSIVENYYTEESRELLTVRPGLTCPGTLYYYVFQEKERPDDGMSSDHFYAEKMLPIKLANDMHYVRNKSFMYDMKMILQAIWIIVCITLGLKPGWKPPYMEMSDFLEQ